MKLAIFIVLTVLLTTGCAKTSIDKENYYEKKYAIIERIDNIIQQEYKKRIYSDGRDPQRKEILGTSTGTLCDVTGNIKQSIEELWREEEMNQRTGNSYLNAMYHDINRFKCELVATLADEEIRTGTRFENKQVNLLYQTITNFVMDKYERMYSQFSNGA